MAPTLSAFPSRQFYAGKLKDGVGAKDRMLKSSKLFAFPNPAKPMFFWHTVGNEEDNKTKSFVNRFTSNF
jgi:superfamily I DNA and/or RNA helicase